MGSNKIPITGLIIDKDFQLLLHLSFPNVFQKYEKLDLLKLDTTAALLRRSLRHLFFLQRFPLFFRIDLKILYHLKKMRDCVCAKTSLNTVKSNMREGAHLSTPTRPKNDDRIVASKSKRIGKSAFHFKSFRLILYKAKGFDLFFGIF